MSKEWFIQAHEEAIEEYLEAHPNATEDQAYDATAEAAMARANEKIAAYIDYLRDVKKEKGL